VVLIRHLVGQSKTRLPPQTHHPRSPEITVTVGKLWARCGHGTANNQDFPQNAEGSGGGRQTAPVLWPNWKELVQRQLLDVLL